MLIGCRYSQNQGLHDQLQYPKFLKQTDLFNGLITVIPEGENTVVTIFLSWMEM